MKGKKNGKKKIRKPAKKSNNIYDYDKEKDNSKK
jgi:hypothetical protein